MADAPRILFLDIETKLMELYSFGIREQDISYKQIKDDDGGRLIHCVGLMWRGDRKAHVLSEWEHGYSEMIRRTHEALEEADAVCTYNGAKFDLPKLDGQFGLEGLPLPPPPTQIDLYKTIRKMGFECSKLDYVAPLFGVGAKVKHEGMPLWIGVREGCPKARKKMARYCGGDVELTARFYERLRPYIRDHPHLHGGGALQCGACGSQRTQSRGVRRTRSSFIQRYQCQACGGWFDGKRTKA